MPPVPVALRSFTARFGMERRGSLALSTHLNTTTLLLSTHSLKDPHENNVCVCTRSNSGKPSAMRTARLHGSPRFHLPSRCPVVCGGPYLAYSSETGHLLARFPLRCFQRFSLPNVATQPCRSPDNWSTSGSSSPVLSY
jgi:hypothetical protein